MLVVFCCAKWKWKRQTVRLISLTPALNVVSIVQLLTKKNATKEDAPNWNHVVTSKEQEQVRIECISLRWKGTR